MTWPVDRQPASCQLPKCWHDRYMCQVDMVVGMETVQGTSIIECHLPKLSLTNVQLPATETGEEVDSIGSLLSWKGQQFFLRNRYIFWVWTCLFLYLGPQQEPLSEGLQNV